MVELDVPASGGGRCKTTECGAHPLATQREEMGLAYAE